MSYNAAHVRDLTGPANGGNFTNTTGSNPYEPHPWGGVPGIFKAFSVESGLSYDVAISARNAASLQGHYLNSSPAGWDLRGNLASQAWDTVVLQDNSTQALPSGAGSVTFAAGASTAKVTLTPVADTKVETDETVGLTLASGTGYRVGTTSTVTGTILNDDPTGPTINPALPTVTLTADPDAVLEDSGGKLVYTFTRTGPTTSPLTITFSTARDGSTAPSVAPGNDFQSQGASIYKFQSGGATTAGTISFPNSTNTVTIAAGATTATLTLVPQADNTVENDESIRLTLNSNANYNVGTNGAVSATILNDDFAAGTDTSLPNITLGLSKTAIFENGTDKLVYEFTRTGSTASSLTVNFGVNGTATLPGNDFTVTGANGFTTGGASDPNLASFQTYAAKLAQYATIGAADGTIPANAHANPAANVYLYETWARPNLVTGALVANTDASTGAITNTTTTAPEYYTSLEAMTADLRAAYEGLAASNPIFKGVAPVGAAFLAAVQGGTAIRDPYTTQAGTTVGNIDLWWDDNLHASKYGSYLSGLTLYGTITGVDPRSLGAVDQVASDLGIDPAVATSLQAVAAATIGFTGQAHWTAPGRVTELTGGGAGLLASAGAFTFSDSNTAATHTVAVTPQTGDLGTLTATLRTDSTGDGTGGAVNWTYTVDDAAVTFLGAGQTRVEHFTVALADQNGATVQRDIAVTIAGTNDAPVVNGVATAHATGGGARVALDAFAHASGIDQGTVLSVANLPSTLPAGVTYDAATHSFILDPSNSAYQSLPNGQSQVVTVQYAVSDGIAAPVAASAVFTVDPAPPAPPFDPNAGGTFTPPPGQTQMLSGITNGSVVADGGGTLVITGTNTYAGPTVAMAGTVIVDGTIVSDVTVSGGATLGGHGTTGDVTVFANGTLSPGNSPGVLTTRNLTLNAGAVLKEELGGTALGQFDQTKVTGTVALSGATLDLASYGAFVSAHGDQFVFIDNDGTDAVLGTFGGLTEGASLTLGGRSYLISYHGGDGNDVMLTDVTLPDAATLALFGSVELNPASQTGGVYALYEGLLGRAPDALGLEYFSNGLQTGWSLTDVAAAILASPEHGGAAADPASAVTALYTNLLHRAPDAVGLQFYADELNHGVSQAQVAVQVATSAEAQGVIAPAFQAGILVPDALDAGVARLYYGLLGRAPDSGGLQVFEAQVKQAAAAGGGAGAAQGLADVAKAILDSPEYALGHTGQTDAAFVDNLYVGALGRHAEPVGAAFFADELAHGIPRTVVALQVAESQEAQSHLLGPVEQGWHLA